MPDWTKLVGGWFLAVVVALALSWGAVAQVRNRVIQPSIEIPTTAVAAAAPQVAAPETTIAPTVIRVEPEIVGSDEPLPTLAADPSAATTTTSGPTPSTSPTSTLAPDTSSTTSPTTTTTQPPPTTTTTQPPPTTTTTQPPPTTTEPPPETQTSSYQLVGGVVTISHAPNTVNFVTAVPQPGYSTDLREVGPDRVRVRFESESQTSDFRAEWEGSELIITKNETGGD